MKFFKSNKKQKEKIPDSWKITSSCLSLILESAKSTYPKEFIGLLRVDRQFLQTITEIVLLPGYDLDSHQY